MIEADLALELGEALLDGVTFACVDDKLEGSR